MANERRSQRADVLHDELERELGSPEETRDYDQMISILQKLENLFASDRCDHLYSACGAQLLTASSASLIHSLEIAGTVRSMDFSAGEKLLAVACLNRPPNSRSCDCSVRIFDLRGGPGRQPSSLLLQIPAQENIYKVAFAPAGNLLAVATGKDLLLFSSEDGDPRNFVEVGKHSFDCHAFKTHSMIFDQNGSRLAIEGQVTSPRNKPISKFGEPGYQLAGFDIAGDGPAEVFKFSSQYPFSGCAFAHDGSEFFYIQNSDEIRRGESKSLWRKITCREAPYQRFYQSNIASFDWHDHAKRDGNHRLLLQRESAEDFHGYLSMTAVPGRNELELVTKSGMERLPMDAQSLSSLRAESFAPGAASELLRRSFHASAGDKRGIFQATERQADPERYFEACSTPALLSILKVGSSSPERTARFDFHQHGFSQSDSSLRDTYTPFALSPSGNLACVAPRRITNKDHAITVLGIYEL